MKILFRAHCALVLLLMGAPARADSHPDWFAGIVRRSRDTTATVPFAVNDSGAVLTADSVSAGGPADINDSEIHLEVLPRRNREARDLHVLLDYNRVDQLLLGGAVSPITGDPFLPRLDLQGSYSLGRSQWNYLFGVQQPIVRGPSFSLGARVYRFTDSDDWELLSRAENALSALLVRQDYRDYFGRRGATGFARLLLGERLNLGLEFRADDMTSLPARPSTWSLFGGSRMFRANPGIPVGTLHAGALSLRYSARASRPAPAPGMDFLLSLEKSGGTLGGDFDYWRLESEHRWTAKIAPGVWINQRIAVGSILSGAAPREYLFYLGGVGTLRGYDYKQFSGDSYYIYNLEYAANLGRHVAAFDRDELLRGLELVLFSEFGKAWNARGQGATHGARPAWDVGAGVQTSGDGFHVYLSQNLQSAGSGPRLSVRLRRSY